MEDNDLPDFDAEDLLAAMDEERRAEERRKDEAAVNGDEAAPASKQKDDGADGVTDSQTGDPLMEITV